MSLFVLHSGEKSNEMNDPAADSTPSILLGQIFYQRSHNMPCAGAKISSAHHRLCLNKVFWPLPGDEEMGREESGCSGLTLVNSRARNIFYHFRVVSDLRNSRTAASKLC